MATRRADKKKNSALGETYQTRCLVTQGYSDGVFEKGSLET